MECLLNKRNGTLMQVESYQEESLICTKVTRHPSSASDDHSGYSAAFSSKESLADLDLIRPIDPEIIPKMIKLLKVNFNICKALASKGIISDKPNGGDSVLITDTSITLDDDIYISEDNILTTKRSFSDPISCAISDKWLDKETSAKIRNQVTDTRNRLYKIWLKL